MIKKFLKYILIFSIFLIFNLICSPINLDEVWNYGFANNIYNGLVPYKDFNMIIPPFYPFLLSLPFHIFGSNMLTLHIFNATILTIMFCLLENLISNKSFLLLIFMFFPHNFSFPNYNTFLFVLLIALIYLEEKFQKTNKDIYNYLVGLALALAILTKHSISFFLLLPSFYYLKNYKVLLKRLITFIIPLIIFFFYLCFSHTLYNFIDLCILGLFDFSSKNNQGFNIYLIFSLLMIIGTIIFIKKDKTIIRNYYILAFYSIIIPIVDLYHFMDAFRAFLIIILNKINKKYFNYEIFSIIVIIILGGLNFKYYNNNKLIVFKYPNDIAHFNYRYINKESYLLTKEISKFLQKNKKQNIIFLSANSYYFKIINDIPCNKFDLINKGNWGYHGTSKLLKELKKQKKALFIIDNKELVKESQIDSQALKYITKNAQKINSIYIYDIYKF